MLAAGLGLVLLADLGLAGFSPNFGGRFACGFKKVAGWFRRFVWLITRSGFWWIGEYGITLKRHRQQQFAAGWQISRGI